MIRLEEIALAQFKNYEAAKFRFGERLVGFFGANGIGKTNLLDAIHYLCFTRSYFHKSDAASVQLSKQGFRIEGRVNSGHQTHELVCVLRENSKKEFQVDGVAYQRMSEHMGRFPCVMVTPDDLSLITGTGEERRKFLDTLLCQIDREYLQELITYNKILQQRNAHLKQLATLPSQNWSVLDILDEQLALPCQGLYEKRNRFLKHFLPLAASLYQQISGETEQCQLIYQSQLHTVSIKDLLITHRQKDLLLERTRVGIHKDDIELVMGEIPFRTYASQGQKKSLLFALKLAEFKILEETQHQAPFLLLDDIFEKLDAQRMKHLLEFVAGTTGQVFITDTHEERLREGLAQTGSRYQLIGIS